MCLSTVYLDAISADRVLSREVARMADDGASVTVTTLFGESRTAAGYGIAEVNLMENTVILKKRGQHG